VEIDRSHILIVTVSLTFSLSAFQAILSMLQDMNFINNYKIDCPTLARYVPRTALGAEPQFPLPVVLKPQVHSPKHS
jgi:hypothetical protein